MSLEDLAEQAAKEDAVRAQNPNLWAQRQRERWLRISKIWGLGWLGRYMASLYQ